MYINKLIYIGCSFVVLNVVGSNPTGHPKTSGNLIKGFRFLYVSMNIKLSKS